MTLSLNFILNDNIFFGRELIKFLESKVHV